jgi:hypothetical protein
MGYFAAERRDFAHFSALALAWRLLTSFLQLHAYSNMEMGDENSFCGRLPVRHAYGFGGNRRAFSAGL